jgi:putative ABC transport system permease protein
MWHNYLTTLARFVSRNKQSTLINVFGMSIGLAVAFMATGFVRYETSFESWIPAVERIHRVENFYHFPGGSNSSLAHIGAPVGEAMANYFPEIESFTRSTPFPGTVKVGEDIFQETVTFVDANYLSFFGFDKMAGNSFPPLTHITSILVSERIAEKLFGNADPVGKTITFDSATDFQVTGVFSDLPDNTHISLDLIALYDESFYERSFPGLNFYKIWNGGLLYTYIKLFPNAPPQNIENGLEAFVNANYVHPNPARAQMTPSEFVTFGIRQISDIHLNSKHQDEEKPVGSIDMVIGLAAIAALVLATAISNYVNLATANATLRAREISLRKVMGAGRREIGRQFIGEAVALSVISGLLAMAIIEVTGPFAATAANVDAAAFEFSADAITMALILGTALGAGLIAGLYPAFHLSSVNPALVLSTDRSGEGSTSWLRAILVTLQFTAAVGLIVSASVIYTQTRYATQMDIGADTNNVSVLRLANFSQLTTADVFRDRLRAVPGVLSVSRSSSVPSDGLTISTAVKLPDQGDADAISAWWHSSGPEFFETYKIELVAGRPLSNEFAQDTLEALPEDPATVNANILINETAIRFLGFENAQDVLGFHFEIGGSNFNNGFIGVNVVGVVPDVHFGSAYDQARPMFFLNRRDFMFAWSVRYEPSAANQVAKEIDNVWKSVYPDAAMTKDDLSELINAQYDATNRQGFLLNILTGVAIAISVMGLFGMTALAATRRTREIAIRKVLGASVVNILSLLVWQFSRPVLLSILIAWPLAFYFISQWLNSFVFRIDLGPGYFIGAGLAALMVAWLTVASHAVLVARSKPSMALRHE